MGIWSIPTYTWSQNNTSCTASRQMDNSVPDLPSGNYYSTQDGKHKLIKLIGFGVQENKTQTTYYDLNKNKHKTQNQSQSSILNNSNLKPYSKKILGDDLVDTSEGEIQTETVNAVSQTIEAADCYNDGSAMLTATFQNAAFEIQEKEIVLPKLNHITGYTKVEVIVASTCAKEGINDLVTYCRLCGVEIAREHMTSEKKAHKAGKPVRENITAGTCSVSGTYEEVVYCRNCNEELSRRTVSTGLDNTVHVHTHTVEENRVEPTADTDGSYDEVVYCDDCGNELSRTTHSIPHS